MNITARMQVVIDEIALDVTDFLRHLTMIGAYNNELTRAVVQDSIDAMLSGVDDIQMGMSLCDDENNTYQDITSGQLNVCVLFVVDGISFRGNFNISPGSGNYCDITNEFSVLMQGREVPVEEGIGGAIIKEGEFFAEPITTFVGSSNPFNEDEIPGCGASSAPMTEAQSALFNSLSV
jgi:hypothetical protein